MSICTHTLVFALRRVEQAPYLLRQDHLPAIHRTPQGKCVALAGQITAPWFQGEQKTGNERSGWRVSAAFEQFRFIGLRLLSQPTNQARHT